MAIPTPGRTFGRLLQQKLINGDQGTGLVLDISGNDDDNNDYDSYLVLIFHMKNSTCSDEVFHPTSGK